MDTLLERTREMATTALVMMADDDYPEGRGRMTTLLTTALELGDDADVYFHGAGVNWLATFDAGEHPFAKAYGPRFEEMSPRIAGTCNLCTNVRFEVGDSARRLGIPILGNEGEHHSLAEVVRSGAMLVTF